MKTPLACASLFVCISAAHADAVLEYSGNNAACHADFQRVAVQGQSLRIDSAPPAQDMSMVYDAAEKTGVALDHRRKQFFELEFDDDAIDFQGDVMKSTSNLVDKKTQQMQAQMPAGMMQQGANGMPQVDPKLIEQMMQQNMQHMTREQREQMETAMKNMRASGYAGSGAAQSAPGRSPGTPEATGGREGQPQIEATGEHRQVGGLACAVERVTQDGQLLREDCRTTLEALDLDTADLKRLQRAIARMQKYASSIKDNLRLAQGAKRDHADPQHLLVERRCFEQGKPGGDVTLRVRREAAPPEWFTTPSDYARMNMGMGGH